MSDTRTLAITHTRYMNVCKSYQIAGICSTYFTMINELNEFMEIKIEVGEEKFRDVLEKELGAFTQEELHEICRKALIQQMGDPNIFRSMFIDQDRYGGYKANDVLKQAAKTINFDETFKELQDGIIAFIKENHMKILHEVAINMFIDGVGRNLFYNDGFRSMMRQELSMFASSMVNNQ